MGSTQSTWGNKQTQHSHKTMISNKTIISSAACLAYANGAKLTAQIESQDIFSDIGSWFEGAGNDSADWTEGAVQDVGSWTVNAFTDAYDWMKDGDNWEAMGKTMVGATVTGFSGDWESGWDLFTNSKMYYGDTYDEIEAAKKKQEEYEKMMKQQAEFCATNEPKVG